MKSSMPCCKETAGCTVYRYMLPKVLGCGKLQRHGYRYILPIDSLPFGAQPPFTLTDVKTTGLPEIQPIQCSHQRNMTLQVRIPILLCLKDCREKCFTVSSFITEQVCIVPDCPPHEVWRHSLNVHAAVRLICQSSGCASNECSAILDVFVDAYLLAPCILGPACSIPCPENKPWYPQICK